MRYVYIKSEPGLWTVGFYHPSGDWEPESDHENSDDAARRCHYLNGGSESRDRGLLEALKDIDAALGQNETHEADVECARVYAREAIAKLEGVQ